MAIKPRVIHDRPSNRLKPAPADWRKLNELELNALRFAGEKIRMRASKYCSLNNKIHRCLRFDGTAFVYRTSLTPTELEALFK